MHGHFSIFHGDFQHTRAGTKYSCGMHIIVVAHQTSCSVSPGKVF